MIDKIDNNQFQDPLEITPSKQANAPRTSQNKQPDASLDVNYASLINQAMQIPEDDTKTLQKAKEMLLSDTLDSPENIRLAAENIVMLGI